MSERAVVGVAALVVLIAALLTAVVRATSSSQQSTGGAPPQRQTSHGSTTLTQSTDPDVNGYVQAPRPGLYRYQDTGAASNSHPFEWAEQVTPQQSPAGTTVEHILTTTGIDETVQFTPTSELQLAYSQTGTSVADEVTCDEQTAGIVLQLPLQQGSSWSTTATCTNLLGNQLVNASHTNVVGRTSQRVGGQSLPVWELVTVTDQTQVPAKGKPSLTRTITITLDISARYGLTIRQVIQQGTDPTTIRTDRITTVQPA